MQTLGEAPMAKHLPYEITVIRKHLKHVGSQCDDYPLVDYSPGAG